MAINTKSRRMAARDAGFTFCGPTILAVGSSTLATRAQATGNYIYGRVSSGYNSGNELLLLFTGVLRMLIP